MHGFRMEKPGCKLCDQVSRAGTSTALRGAIKRPRQGLHPDLVAGATHSKDFARRVRDPRDMHVDVTRACLKHLINDI